VTGSPKQWFALLFLFAAVAYGSASDIYLAQNASGANTGADCADAHAYTFFNSSANWGGGASQIGPGTTVHLCGTFSGSPGQQLLVFQGSGASGNPITLHFENGAVMSAPYWSAQGAINTNGNTWLTIDGGTNGKIQNTSNGTSGATCLNGPCSTRQDSRFVFISGCSTCNIEVTNLSLINIYVHTPNVGDTMPGDNGVEGVFFSGNHSNINVNNVVCHDAVICIDGWGNNISLSNNELYNCNRCIVFGSNVPTSNFAVHDSYIHDFSNWDDPSTAFHHDGIHLFPNSGNGNMSGVALYNNQFANPGKGYNTAFMYLEGSFSAPKIFNNACILTSSQANPCIMAGYDGGASSTISGAIVANNTCFGGNTSNGYCYTLGPGYSNVTFANNVGTQGGSLLAFTGSSTPTMIDHNMYENICADSGACNMFGYHGSDYTSFPSWKTALPASSGQETNSVFNTMSNLKISTSDGQLQSGSPGIGAGANLSNLGIAALNSGKPLTVGVHATATGTQRPSSGAWDIGAYSYSTASGGAPAPPTGLSAAAQ